MIEITYQEAAEVLDLSLRETKRVIREADCVTPLRYGYRTVRFDLSEIIALRAERHLEEMRKAVNGTRRQLAKRFAVKLQRLQRRNGHAKRKAA